MEAKGVKTVRNLALVNADNTGLALALTLGDDTKIGRKTARRKLWNWKGAAAALVGVDDIGELPKLKTGPKSKQERTTKEQDALDVATRWVAHADAPDADLATKYAEALAAIARDYVANQQKKKKRRRYFGGPPWKLSTNITVGNSCRTTTLYTYY